MNNPFRQLGGRLQASVKKRPRLSRKQTKQKNLREEIALRRELIKVKNQFNETVLSMTQPKNALSPDLYADLFSGSNAGAGNTGWWAANTSKLRHVSRIAYWDSETGRSMINRLVDTVVGSKLELQAAPNWLVLDNPLFSDKETRKAWSQKTEAHFKNWAKQKNVDRLKERNLYKMMRTAFFYLLRDGEYFIVLRYSPSRNKNPLSLQFIPPENISGGTPKKGNRVLDGIEYNEHDEAVAYHIYDEKDRKTKRITKTGPKSGLTFVIHNYIKENEKQRRGIPMLSKSIPGLTKLADYQILELQAAVINALFAVWVKPPKDTDGRETIPTEGITSKLNTPQTKGVSLSDWESKIEKTDMSQGGLVVENIPAGHELESFDTKRPNTGFAGFCKEVKKSITASESIPVSVADFDFDDSYSSIRGQLLLFWNTVTKFRDDHSWDFCDEILKMWLWGEIRNQKIEAPGWENEELRNAWSNATWNGNQRPDIDPLKSVNAHEKELMLSLKTFQRATAERGGGDFDENLEANTPAYAQLAAATKEYYAAKKGTEETIEVEDDESKKKSDKKKK